MSLTSKTKASTYKDILQMDNSNSGVDTTLRSVKDGEGTVSSVLISDDQFRVKPQTDDTTAVLSVQDKDGNTLFVVDSTNDLVKALGHNVNTNYATFGTAGSPNFLANEHYAMGYSGYPVGGGEVPMGTGTDPDTTLTLATTADDFVNRFMYLHDNITIDSVRVFVSGAGSTATDVRFHLMSYDIDTSNGSTSGDLSNGLVLADGSDLTSVEYSAIDSQSLTIQSADVNAGKVIVATALFTDVTDKKSVSIQLKYHLR